MDDPELWRLIVDYLLKHPEAGDTLEGIACWWIGRVRIETDVDRVAGVVQTLVSGKFLIERDAGEGRKIYFLNRSRLDDLQELRNKLVEANEN